MNDLDRLYDFVLTGKLEQSKEATLAAVTAGIDPQTIINKYMSPAMEEIGKRFEAGQAFVPELLMSARAMKGALDLLKPLLAGQTSSNFGKVIIGTVKGDLHDIGKNLVSSMLEGCGFEVINLGVDISSDEFVVAIKEYDADILCMSALLTTTMGYMKEVINTLNKCGIRRNVKIMVGGAPVSYSFAQEIGADGYSDNANAAVTLAKKLMGV